MDHRKKQIAVISAIAAVLFITPLIVFAVVYLSGPRQNRFHPAEASIQVKEGDDIGGGFEKEYTWTVGEDSCTVAKPVQIYDVRGKNDEYLRVRFVPMWYDADGNIVGGNDAFSNYRSAALNAEQTALEFKNASGRVLLSLKLEQYWNSSWTYDADEQCFYYTGKIKSGDISPKLITDAVIPKSVYDATADYTLHIEVLADAIQTNGNAQSARWEEP